MKKIVSLLIFCLLLTSTLTGCWNRKELITLAIVQAFGIDQTEDDQVDISAQILKPILAKGSSEKDDKGVWVVSSTGETVFDAIRNASLKTDRRLFFAHNDVIVIGEETAIAGIAPFLDFLGRDHESHEIAHIFIARGKARDILLGEHEQERVPSQAIENLVKTSGITSQVPEVNLKDLLGTLASKTNSSVAPGIKIQKKDENGASKNVVILDSTAIFKKDKLIGWFNHAETRGLLWVLGEVKTGIITVKSPLEKTKNVSLEIIKTSTQLKPEITEGKLSITIAVKENGNLAEQMLRVDLAKPDTLAELEKRQAIAIEEEIQTALSKAQTWNVDIFKFGDEFHRKYPHEWPELEKNWEKEFPKIAVNFEITAKLNGIGLSTPPADTGESQK
ncbi:Ger(x)C family spore germination protein [Desulfitobacterium metallireducens]|uniref:Germination protein Ger(X)C n=1 Tax=Desulfitobacterium metallireducens DSM 15288 TaxID=871968 RepID=W0E9U0_9FIRM|nr:Ger(x)C family spore germination protein [Desulfitobacterium metallireducens]AHF05816.1 germination protein Ger(x)C [Desulfitobacterium metallireducens DSM 15288]